MRTKADNNNPFSLPVQAKRPREATRNDRTSDLGVSLAEGKANPANEPWFSNMAHRYAK